MGHLNKVIILGVWLVLLVDGVQAGQFVDNKDGTVLDASTNLMWQKTDDGVERVWTDALSYCESLALGGYDDWSLPKINMLENLIEPSFSPTVNPALLVKPSYYWSSTESRNSVTSAKYVNFFYGNTYAFSKDNTYYVICSRDASDSMADPLTVSFGSDVKADGPPFEVDFVSKIVGGSGPYFFEWDFNDGDFSSLSNPSHLFTNPGRYNVALTISDNNGAIAVAMADVLIPATREPQKTGLGAVDKGDETVEQEEPVVIDAKEDVASDDLAEGAVPAVETGLEATSVLELEEATEGEAGLAGSVASLPENGEETQEDKIVELLSAGTSLAEQDESDNNTRADATLDLVKFDNLELSTEVSTPESEEAALAAVQDGSADAGRQDEDLSGDDMTDDRALSTLETTGGRVDSDAVLQKTSKNILKIFSSKNGYPVQTVPSGQGVLSYSFVNGMGGDADWNKDSKVTARELKGYMGMAIENLSEGGQEAVITVSDGDFSVCAEAGVTHVLAVGVDFPGENKEGLPYAGLSAEAVAKTVSEKCSSWKQLVLTGQRAGRNNIFRALLKMGQNVAPGDNFLFYFAGASEGSERGLNLYTYDTLSELSGLTGLLYDDLAGLLEEIEATNLIMLYEVGSHVEK